MNGEFDYNHHEINRVILLLRTERDAEKKQELCNKLVTLNTELKRIYDEREKR